jgi:predicted Fe-Mo cluster-binding NifX family protein
MKIAIETNDGVNISSPYNLLKNFMVYEVDEKNVQINSKTSVILINDKSRLQPIKNINKTKDMIRDLCDCSTIISHGLNKPLLNNLRKSGVDVFITFQNTIDDALNHYLRNRMIHGFVS